ncbi:MAG: hypothetical protein LBP22_15915 [Deltaproteobacteria bacterium]|jgi:type I restriction enzyme M protein|nr:hypothetical protein [Deltaproteobacteria bacterium]
MDAAGHKRLVPWLIVRTSIAGKSETRTREPVAESAGFEESADFRAERNILLVPSSARRPNETVSANKPEPGQLIDQAVDSSDLENREQKGLPPKTSGRRRTKRRLG